MARGVQYSAHSLSLLVYLRKKKVGGKHISWEETATLFNRLKKDGNERNASALEWKSRNLGSRNVRKLSDQDKRAVDAAIQQVLRARIQNPASVQPTPCVNSLPTQPNKGDSVMDVKDASKEEDNVMNAEVSSEEADIDEPAPKEASPKREKRKSSGKKIEKARAAIPRSNQLATRANHAAVVPFDPLTRFFIEPSAPAHLPFKKRPEWVDRPERLANFHPDGRVILAPVGV